MSEQPKRFSPAFQALVHFIEKAEARGDLENEGERENGRDSKH